MKLSLSVFLVLISLFSLYFEVDESAMALYRESFDRAVYSFALAKGLNAIISVIQSSEINVSFFVGATVGLGQMLDPINDLVERFSWIMLASSVSLGVQHLLLLFGKSAFIKIALSVSVLSTILIIWIKKFHAKYAFVLGLKTIFLLLILRFGAVVFIYATSFLYNQVYIEQYNNSTSFIKDYKQELEVIQKNKTDLDSYWSKFEEKMEIFSKKVIKLITIFIVTTVLMPLLFLWLFLLIIKFIYNLKIDNDKIVAFLNKRN